MVEQVSESTNAEDYYVTDQLGSTRGLTTRLAMSEAGAQATVVAGWMAEVQGERLRAEADLVAATPREPMSKDQVRNLVLHARDIASVLAEADPDLKADLYAELGVQVRYDPFERVITPPAGSYTQVCVRGGLQPASVGSNPVHLIVYKVEPPVRAVLTA